MTLDVQLLLERRMLLLSFSFFFFPSPLVAAQLVMLQHRPLAYL